MKVIGLIAETSFGRVELVQLDDGTTAARKVFAPRPEVLRNVTIDQLRKRFAREVRIQRALPDNFVMPVLDADLEADPPWFVMPLADTTLEQYMSELKTIPEQRLAALDQTLEALAMLHGLDYAHRDLKPSNILLHQSRWKLADLGLALLLATQSTKLTMSQQGWGTLAYCAPEQFTNFKTAGQPADIFAFGCMLHDFFGDHDRIPCQRLSAPGKIGAVIEKCTEVDPKKRFKSVHRLRAALFDVLAQPPEVNQTEFSQEAASWAGKLADVATLSPEEITNLARFVRGLEFPSLAPAVFIACNEERLAQLKQRDADAWIEVATKYCEWAKTPNFSFEYCDVIVGRLEQIYQDGSVEMKANAALAAAELAESHNRWYLMGRVLEMGGPSAEENVAQRIAIEIRAGELEEQFKKCASRIHKDPSQYHPLIRAVLATDPFSSQDTS
jgi:hypothetical protein